MIILSIINFSEIVLDLKKQIQKLQNELVEANQQSLSQQQQQQQQQQQVAYDEQMTQVIRNKQETFEMEIIRMKSEYEQQLSAINDVVLRLQNDASRAQLEEKDLFGNEERKAVMQDVYTSICTYFNPDSDDRDMIQYSTTDVLKRIRSVLKSML